MADKNKDGVYIDPAFFLPPNVIDLRYDTDEKDSNENLDRFDSSTDPIDADPDIFWSTEEAESTSMIPIPQKVTVVGQTTRALPGGGYVVDVTFEVPDIPGVQSFDLSVIKV